MGSGGIEFSSRTSSALAAVSVVLILLYLFWRFIWQIKKHATGRSASAPSPSSSSSATLPSCPREGQALWRAGETSQSSSPLPLFVRVEVAPPGCGMEKADCAVCLAELGDGKAAARLVPGCGHGFHVECIEAWFRVNSTCPLCRAAVPAAGQSAGGAPQCNRV